MPEWISVNDRMPEISLDPNASYSSHRAKVIVATESGDVRSMIYTWNQFAKRERDRLPRWEEVYNRLAGDVVTHWMPFPEHPNKQKGGD